MKFKSQRAACQRGAVMTLRTPRRRISPRTRQRYRAIREFFRRAIGSTSQQDIKINSSIALNVTDLKHKIGGIQNHIEDISRQCQHLSCLQNNIGREVDQWSEEEEAPVKEQTEESSDNKCHCTHVLYENRSNNCRKSGESIYQYSEGRRKSNEQQTSFVFDNKKSKSKDTIKKTDSGLRRYNTHSNLGSFCSDYSTSSFHSLCQRRGSQERVDDRAGRRHSKKYARRPDLFEISFNEGSRRRHKHEKQDKFDILAQYEEKLSRNRRRKKEELKVDEQFIADIIKRQYKPVKLFGKRDSEISQFSAPVCRDQDREYSIVNNINTHKDKTESPHLCPCYYEGHRRPKYVRNNDLSDIRSICDTRMYSSKRQPRHRHRRKYADMYSDSTVYDIVPVREKSSPKSRRRFVQENMVAKDYYKEVPPSPKTHRPRLNLKAQYYEYEDVMQVNHPNRRYVMMKPGRHQEYVDTIDSETTSVSLQRRMRRERKEFQRHLKEQNIAVARGVEALNTLQFPTPVPDQANIPINDTVNTTINDTSLNKTQDTETSVADKADKALCEIKDILQSFLQEIKKEATSSHNMKSELSANSQPEESDKAKEINKITDNIPNHVPPCLNAPFPTPFTNPYCYPVMPMCPINYGGYALPSPSFSCHACFNNSACAKHTSTAENVDEPPKNATDELIKEIYKYVAKSPAIKLTKKGKGRNTSRRERNCSEDKMTTRSADDSTATRRNNLPSTPRTRRRNAKIGTRTVKCYSKSCEAIGSRLMPDSVKTSTTLSDTVLDKLSLKVSESISDSDISSESVDFKKKKTGKFAKILQTLGLKKKKKYDDEDDLDEDLEEEDESESEAILEKKLRKARRKHEPPFKQHLQTYMMYGQEYYHRPPVPPYSPRGPYGYHTPPLYDPRGSPYHMGHEMYTPHEVHRDTIHEHAASSHYRYDRPHPSAPPYPYEMPPQRAPSHAPPHARPHPQVPLCLKEVEVKSTGTQSERKLSFLRMLTKKPPQASPTQSVQQQPLRPPPKQKKPSWMETLTTNKTEGKTLKDILKGLNLDLEDPQKFQYKTQRQLAEGDRKMRNAMLKKIFHKRNPFSPNNLVMRTLMGKDPSSYGEPGVVLKNRLFIT